MFICCLISRVFQYIEGYKNLYIVPTLCLMLLVGAAINIVVNYFCVICDLYRGIFCAFNHYSWRFLSRLWCNFAPLAFSEFPFFSFFPIHLYFFSSQANWSIFWTWSPSIYVSVLQSPTLSLTCFLLALGKLKKNSSIKWVEG